MATSECDSGAHHDPAHDSITQSVLAAQKEAEDEATDIYDVIAETHDDDQVIPLISIVGRLTSYA